MSDANSEVGTPEPAAAEATNGPTKGETATVAADAREPDTTPGASRAWSPLQRAGIGLAWVWVLGPLGYGLYKLAERIPALFGG